MGENLDDIFTLVESDNIIIIQVLISFLNFPKLALIITIIVVDLGHKSIRREFFLFQEIILQRLANMIVVHDIFFNRFHGKGEVHSSEYSLEGFRG